MAEKGIIPTIVETVESAVDAANRATTEFLQSHKIIPGPSKTPPESTAAAARQKQGPGFEQAIIE